MDNVGHWCSWIRSIAAETSPEEIARHIQEHCTVDLARDIKDGKLADWHASLTNLLGVFQIVHFGQFVLFTDTVPRMVELLHKKYKEQPDVATPPPRSVHAK